MKLLALIACDDSAVPFLRAIGDGADFAVEHSANGTFLVTSNVCPEAYTGNLLDIPYVWRRIREWVESLAGALVLLQQGRIAFKNLMRETDDGNREWMPITGSIHSVGSTSSGDGTPHATAASWLAFAAGDPNVARVLREWSKPPTWFSLYRIYEIIRDDLGGPRSLGGVAKSRIERVIAAANHVGVSGAEGRHAISKGPAPTNAPDLGDATRTMRAWSEGWLRSKLTGDIRSAG